MKTITGKYFFIYENCAGVMDIWLNSGKLLKMSIPEKVFVMIKHSLY